MRRQSLQNFSPRSESDHPKDRVDGIQRYYDPIERSDKVASCLFWLSAVLSVATLYASYVPWERLRDVPVLLFCATVVANALVALHLRFELMPLAEQKRRKQLLSDALGVPLTTEKTVNYYNNPCSPSFVRLGANVMENAFFAKAVCAEMANSERLRVAAYLLTWLVAVLYRSTDLQLIGIATQTIFSAEVLARWLSVEYLRRRNDWIYDELYHEFLHKDDLSTPHGSATLLDAFVAYETAKAVAGIKQSTRVFSRLNESLSKEWEDIRAQLYIR